MVSRIRARVWIQVRYWLVGWPEARTVEFSEEEYFDEEAFWPEFARNFGVNSTPRHDEIADYLPVPRASLRRTELTLASSRADEPVCHFDVTYWENGTCQTTEIVDGDIWELIISLAQRETPTTFHVLRYSKHPRLRDRVLSVHMSDTPLESGMYHEVEYLPVKGETTLYKILTEEEKNGDLAKPCTEQEGLLRCYVRGKPEPYFWSTEELPTDDGHNDVTNPPTWLQRQAMSKLGVSRADIRRIEYTASNQRVRKILETV